jgi:hypothetical protein
MPVIRERQVTGGNGRNFSGREGWIYLAAEARSEAELAQGFGAALILLMLTAALFLGAYYLKGTFTKTWDQKDLMI